MTDTACLFTTGSVSFGTGGFSASAGSHPGRSRQRNEDRYELDPQAGFMLVVDGIGGHAAGDVAAGLAADAVRRRMRVLDAPAADRVRDAILLANARILERSTREPEMKGMACVLTLAAVSDGALVVGHVGDSRLYKLSAGGISKLTHDHSPIGDREDRGELTEMEAMRHPRRNEIFRDVGSRPHQAADEDFIELFTTTIEADAAVLLCSDGLSDMVTSVEMQRIIRAEAGDPASVVGALIDAANAAGGKDNITAVYVQGPDFADRIRNGATLPLTPTPIERDARPPAPARSDVFRWPAWRPYLFLVLGVLLGVLATLALVRSSS
ncbi:MAG TPA: protein phosphatase 2C domain-containing protein [Vicinamibacterales bacterium]|nr:protein phosphatase 2C domain-containing protein [Vicinamibacterales bacterium]